MHGTANLFLLSFPLVLLVPALNPPKPVRILAFLKRRKPHHSISGFRFCGI